MLRFVKRMAIFTAGVVGIAASFVVGGLIGTTTSPLLGASFALMALSTVSGVSVYNILVS